MPPDAFWFLLLPALASYTLALFAILGIVTASELVRQWWENVL